MKPASPAIAISATASVTRSAPREPAATSNGPTRAIAGGGTAGGAMTTDTAAGGRSGRAAAASARTVVSSRAASVPRASTTRIDALGAVAPAAGAGAGASGSTNGRWTTTLAVATPGTAAS